MNDLIERAKLTDEEMERWPTTVTFDAAHPAVFIEFGYWREVADAATAKALWAVVAWLSVAGPETHGVNTYPGRKWIAFDLALELQRAGIERPVEP